MKKSILIFFLIFGLLNQAPGQYKQDIDELNAKAEEFINTNVDSAIIIAKKAFSLYRAETLAKSSGVKFGIYV